MSSSIRFEIPEKPLVSEAKASSLYARHAKFKARVKCAELWTHGRSVVNDESHPQHRCSSFAGHVQTPHKCACGATLKVQR